MYDKNLGAYLDFFSQFNIFQEGEYAASKPFLYAQFFWSIRIGVATILEYKQPFTSANKITKKHCLRHIRHRMN